MKLPQWKEEARPRLLEMLNERLPLIKNIRNSCFNMSVSITHSINEPMRPKLDKFDIVWDITEKELKQNGDKLVLLAFRKSWEYIDRLEHITGYLRALNYKREVIKTKHRDYINSIPGFQGGRKCPAPDEHLTKAMLTFVKNYYGIEKYEKILYYRIWNLGSFGIYVA